MTIHEIAERVSENLERFELSLEPLPNPGVFPRGGVWYPIGRSVSLVGALLVGSHTGVWNPTFLDVFKDAATLSGCSMSWVFGFEDGANPDSVVPVEGSEDPDYITGYKVGAVIYHYESKVLNSKASDSKVLNSRC